MSERLTTSQVAHRLDCAAETVRRMDATLKPERVGPRRERIYDPLVVERIAKDRAR